MENVNRHIEDFLSYYTALDAEHPPGYAVMLDGPWGIGKTYLVRDLLKRLVGPQGYCYVSLYGVSKTEDIDDAIVAAMFPVAGHKATRITAGLIKSAAGMFKISTNLKLADIVDKFRGGLYVFDDLERCTMPIDVVLGYINEFVEHNGCKVVLIANESEIDARADAKYRRRREKLIGKTLQIRPDTARVLDLFIGKIKDAQTRDFVASQKQPLTRIFEQSQAHNLRILQQTLWDFERLYALMDARHRANEIGCAKVLATFAAVSLEIKAGRLNEVDIEPRSSRAIEEYIRRRKSRDDDDGALRIEKPAPLRDAATRYRDADVYDPALSNRILIDVLIRGFLDKDMIAESLDRSPAFAPPDKKQAWKTVWHWKDVEDDEFQAALTEMEQQFEQRHFAIAGEILHVFGLRLWAAQQNFLSFNPDVVVQQCLAYVEDLNEKRLLPLESMPQQHPSEGMAYDGLDVYMKTSQEFMTIFQNLTETGHKAEQDLYPLYARELLQLMTKNLDEFKQKIADPDSFYNYTRAPVLKQLKLHDFYPAFDSLSIRNKEAVFSAILLRYQDPKRNTLLRREKHWLEELLSMLKRDLNISHFTRLRLNGLIDSYLKPAIKRLDEAESA